MFDVNENHGIKNLSHYSLVQKRKKREYTTAEKILFQISGIKDPESYPPDVITSLILLKTLQRIETVENKLQALQNKVNNQEREKNYEI